MITGLDEIFDKFSKSIIKINDAHSSFFDFPVLYKFFTKYINEKYKRDINAQEFLSRVLSIQDIIEACTYYCENSQVNKVSGINKFLKALSKFCNDFMKPNHLDNPTLFAALPFTQFNGDVRELIKNKKLSESNPFPSITSNDFENICKYLNNQKNKTIVQREISIMLKLIALYGFKLEKIRFFNKSNYNINTKLLTVSGLKNIKIPLELHPSISKELDDYLNDQRCNQTQLLFLNSKNKIINPIFFSNDFRNIENTYEISVRLTTTGIAKYAIKNMLLGGLSTEQVKIISGMESTIVDACDKEIMDVVNQTLGDDVNTKIRAIRRDTQYDSFIQLQ